MRGSTTSRTIEAGNRDDGSDRAVSDVVAFVLTFSIIITSMALVSTAGLDQLTNVRDAEQIKNAEHTMQANAVELDRIGRGDPFEVLQFGVSGGNLWVNQTELTVKVTNSSGGETVRNISVNAIEHRFQRTGDDLTVAYESGAVMRSDAAVFRYGPGWHVSNRTAILSVVNLTTTETIVVGNGYRQNIALGPTRAVPGDAPVADPDNTIQIAAERNTSRNSTVIEHRLEAGTTANVTVNVSATAYPEVWGHHLERNGWDPVSDRADAYRVTRINDTVLVHETTIDIL